MPEQLPSAILDSTNSQDSIFALELDTKQRFDNILSGIQKPIDYPIPDFNKDMFPNGLSQDRLLDPSITGNTIGEALFSPDIKIAQLATDRIRATQDKLLTNKGVGVPERFPYDKVMNKYLKGDFGYNPYMSIEDNEDFNYRYDYMNQSAFERIFKNLGTGLTRFAGSVAFKLGQTFGYLGTMIGEGFQELAEGLGGPSNDFMTGVADNSLSRWFEQQEQNMKDGNLLSVFKPKGWEDKGFFQKLGHGAFWTDEVADGAAFMGEMIASMYLLGGLGKVGSIGKLGATEINMASKLGKFGSFLDRTVRFSTGAQDLSGIGRWAFATTSESAFEASGKYKQIKDTLLAERAAGLNNLTDDEIQKRAGDGAAASFKSNMLILSASNAFENRFIFGPLFKKMGISEASAGQRGGTLNKFGRYIGISDKTDNLDNLLAANRKTYDYSTWVGKKIDWKNPNSRLRFYGSRALSSTAMEGFWEENAQLAVERLSSTGNFSVGAFLDKYTQQTIAAAKGLLPGTKSTDPEAETNIGLGAIIGIGGTTTAAKIGGGDKRFLGERRQKELNINKVVDLYNKYRKEYLSFQDIYEKNEDGSPKLDAEGNLQFKDAESMGLMDGMARAMSMHSAIDKVANPLLRKQLQDIALSSFVFAAKSAGIFNKVSDKFKNIELLDEEALKALGYDPNTIIDVPYLRRSFEQAGKFYDEVYLGKPAKISKGFTEEDERGRKASLYDAKMKKWSAQSIAEEYKKNLDDKEYISLFSDEVEDQDPLVTEFNTLQYRIQKLQQFELFSRDNGDFFSIHFKNQFEKLKKEREKLIESLIPKIDTGYSGFEGNPLVFTGGFLMSKGLHMKIFGKGFAGKSSTSDVKTGVEATVSIGNIIDTMADARIKSFKQVVLDNDINREENDMTALLNARDENMIKYAELLNIADQYAYVEERLGNPEMGLHEHKLLAKYYDNIQKKDKQQDDKAKLHSVVENDNGTFSVVTPKGTVIGTPFKTREEAEDNAKDLDEALKEAPQEAPVKETEEKTDEKTEKTEKVEKTDKKEESGETDKINIVTELDRLVNSTYQEYISGMDLDASLINFVNQNYKGNEDTIRQYFNRFFINRYINPLKDKIANGTLTKSEDDQNLISAAMDVMDFINDLFEEGLNNDLYNSLAPEITSVLDSAEKYEYKESEEQQFEQVGEFFISQEPDGKWKLYNSDKESLGLKFNTREEAIADIEKARDVAEAEKREMDIQLAKELYRQIKAGKQISEFLPEEQAILNNPDIFTQELKDSVDKDDAKLAASEAPISDENMQVYVSGLQVILDQEDPTLSSDRLLPQLEELLVKVTGFKPDSFEKTKREFIITHNGKKYVSKGGSTTAGKMIERVWDVQNEDWENLLNNWIAAKYDANVATLEGQPPIEESTEVKVGDTVAVLTKKDGKSTIKEDRGDKVLLEDGRQVSKENVLKISSGTQEGSQQPVEQQQPPEPPKPPINELPPSEGTESEHVVQDNELDIIIDSAREGGIFAFVTDTSEVVAVEGDTVKLTTTTSSQKEQALRLHNVLKKMSNPGSKVNFWSEDKDGNRLFKVKFIKGDRNIHKPWIFDLNRQRYEEGKISTYMFPFIISVIVDSEGKLVYFDTQGNIVDKSTGQPVAFQFNVSDYQNTENNKGLMFSRRSNMNVGPITTIQHGFETDSPLDSFNEAVRKGLDVYGNITMATSGIISRYGSDNSFQIKYTPSLYKFRTISEMMQSGDINSDAIFLIENGKFLEYSWDSRGTEQQLVKTGQVYLFDKSSGLYISLTAKQLKDVSLNGKPLLDKKTSDLIEALDKDGKITADDSQEEMDTLKSIHDFLRLMFYSKDISFSLEEGGTVLRKIDKRDIKTPLLSSPINFSKGISTISNPISGEEFDYQELMMQNLVSGAIPAEVESGKRSFEKLNKRLIFEVIPDETQLIDMVEGKKSRKKPVQITEDEVQKYVGKTFTREGTTTMITVASYKDGEFTIRGENGKETVRSKEQFLKDLSSLQEVTAPPPSEEVQQEFTETKTFSQEELNELMNKSDTSAPDDLKDEIDLGCD